MIKSITIVQMRNNQVINQHFATIFIEILSDLANITNIEKTFFNNTFDLALQGQIAVQQNTKIFNTNGRSQRKINSIERICNKTRLFASTTKQNTLSFAII